MHYVSGFARCGLLHHAARFGTSWKLERWVLRLKHFNSFRKNMVTNLNYRGCRLAVSYVGLRGELRPRQGPDCKH